jgi:O-antigen ligase
MFDKGLTLKGFDVSFFLFFAFSLAIPSGYSYGAVGALLCAIFGAKAAFQKGFDLNTKYLVTSMVIMAFVWGVGFDGWWSWTGSDLLPRYILAGGVLAVASVWGVRSGAIEWGLAAGALGALLIAWYQNHFLGITKATGHTNAIQYGGIAIYLGVSAWCIALLSIERISKSMILFGFGACGLIASMLSETRGAWLALPVLLAVIVFVLFQNGYKRWAIIGLASACILISAAMVPYGEKIYSRIKIAIDEVSLYIEDPSAASLTSVGQRLEQWRSAYLIIKEHPWSGSGYLGNHEAKQALVDQNISHPSIMEYGHAHNEIIDMLAKRGIIGLIGLLVFYATPICLFWPSKKRVISVPVELRKTVLSIRLAATLLPISYFCFGWTQVFFAHNSGNMFYIFGIAAFWGALQRLEGKTLQYQ